MASDLTRAQRWTRAGRLVEELDIAMADLRTVVRMHGESNLPAGVDDAVRRLAARVAALRVRLVTAASMSGPAQREVARSLRSDVRQAESMARELAVHLASDSDSDALDDAVEHLELLIEATRELDSPELDVSVRDRARLLRGRVRQSMRRHR